MSWKEIDSVDKIGNAESEKKIIEASQHALKIVHWSTEWKKGVCRNIGNGKLHNVIETLKCVPLMMYDQKTKICAWEPEAKKLGAGKIQIQIE